MWFYVVPIPWLLRDEGQALPEIPVQILRTLGPRPEAGQEGSMTFPFVAVEWDDAWGDMHEIITPEEVGTKHKPTKMETRGWLLRDDERGLSIFNERCLDEGDNSYRGRTFIPRAMVKKVKVISKTRKKRNEKVADLPPPATG